MNKYAKGFIFLVIIVIILRSPVLLADIKEIIQEILKGLFGPGVTQ